MNAYLFNDRNRPTSWQEGYDKITERLNEDLLFRKTQHLDQKVAAQRQTEAIEALKRGFDEQRAIYSDLANKPYQTSFQRPDRPQGQWQGNSGYPTYQNQGWGNSQRQPWVSNTPYWPNSQPRFRAPQPRFPNHAQGFRPRRPSGLPRPNFGGQRPNFRQPRPRFNNYNEQYPLETYEYAEAYDYNGDDSFYNYPDPSYDTGLDYGYGYDQGAADASTSASNEQAPAPTASTTDPAASANQE
jgi:hypothetical protein